ncbi:hypothetical protein TL16_g11448 [Triparma laevis f. inornata]|uniref:RING-type domain-containing protein n=1 Tax=Triparma laevis f. inornata TaxID=1714386 RepID=A0A9W7BEP9_9STRA|nr:hypothetical protein TL16_g11448 [Triparma laevis f. inornata]
MLPLPRNQVILQGSPDNHWKWLKKICVAPQKKISAPLRPSDAPLKGPVNEDEEDEDKGIICLDNVVNAKLRPCGHSATCRECTRELITRSEPCLLCRKKIAGFDVGKRQSSIGEHGLWPRSLKNLSELASGQDFNEYFQKHFNGNEVTYLRWKDVRSCEQSEELIMRCMLLAPSQR